MAPLQVIDSTYDRKRHFVVLEGGTFAPWSTSLPLVTVPFFAWPEGDRAGLSALAPGSFRYLPKPFTVQSLAECLHCLLGNERRWNCPKHGLPDALLP
jgi:hypothetical protein